MDTGDSDDCDGGAISHRIIAPGLMGLLIVRASEYTPTHSLSPELYHHMLEKWIVPLVQSFISLKKILKGQEIQ